MPFSRRLTPLIFVLVIAAAIGVGYFAVENSQLKNELAIRNSEAEDDAALSRARQMLSHADSVFMKGNWEEAKRIYEEIQPRQIHDLNYRNYVIEQLRRLEQDRRDLKAALVDSPGDATSEDFKESTEYSKADSLSFALEKSQVQLKSLKQQLKTKSYGQYITFKSSKGNRLHYVGQVKNGKANGYGIAILDSGSRYEGDWKDNQRHGQGSFYWIDGEHYEGSYKNDQRSGQGTYYWTNGEYFSGQWEKDMRNGKGVFYGADGEVMARGTWQDDELLEASKN